mgnify:FL=1
MEALQELGFRPEVHEVAKSLVGYEGRARPEVAHIIIPRSQLRSASNDLGFKVLPNGKIEAIVSEYDQRAGFGAEWLGKVTQLAGVHTLLKKAQARGLRAVRQVDAKGRLQVVVYAR